MAVEHQPNDKQRGASAYTTFGTFPPTTYHGLPVVGKLGGEDAAAHSGWLG